MMYNMRSTPFTTTAPGLGLPGHGESQVLGAVIWLWMHSANHRALQLCSLSQTLLPPLQAQQYILATSSDGKGGYHPVAYMAWANFSAAAERRYLHSGPNALVPAADWNSGDRMWMTDWVIPFGHASSFRREVGALLDESCFRALYCRDDERGQYVKSMRGDKVSLAAANAWWRARPLPETAWAA
jgi:cytolysin-activating lysine-acyltransferase